MPKQPDTSDDKQSKRTILTRHNYEGIVEQRIQQAFEDGLFDNLPGAGKPLKLDDDSLVPGEDRAGFRLLKANGFAPAWIEARREIDAERARLDTWLKQANHRWPRLPAAGRATLQINYRRKLDDLQRLIVNFNLTTPPGVSQVEALRIPDELLKLGA